MNNSINTDTETNNCRVVFLTQVLTHYRVNFHNLVREMLAEKGIHYDLIYGQPNHSASKKNDQGTLYWARKIKNYYIHIFGAEIVYQPVICELTNYDLIVIGQENKLLINYLLFFLRALKLTGRIALWGHGRNFQTSDPDSVLEKWKAIWSRRADWWFAYTEITRDIIVRIGFNEKNITVLNNAIDTAELRNALCSVTEFDMEKKRLELSLSGKHTALFVGSIYPEKRLPFLIEAVIAAREQVPDLELIVVGDGPENHVIRDAAKQYSWIKHLGVQLGRDKATLMKICDVMVVPGLMGLSILDAFAAGLPIVTTDYPFHSPEFSYFQDNYHGLLSRPWKDQNAFAQSIVAIFTDRQLKMTLSKNCLNSFGEYSVEQMAERFSCGVIECLFGNRKN